MLHSQKLEMLIKVHQFQTEQILQFIVTFRLSGLLMCSNSIIEVCVNIVRQAVNTYDVAVFTQ